MRQATTPLHRTLTAWRVAVLWLVALALPIYGASATSLRLLGPAHWHAGAAEVPAALNGWLGPVFDTLQAAVQQVQELRAHAHARAHAAGHHHEHHQLLRHWHDADDASVHTVESADAAVSDLVSGASVGSATLTLAPPAAPVLSVASSTISRWPAAATPTWTGLFQQRLSYISAGERRN